VFTLFDLDPQLYLDIDAPRPSASASTSRRLHRSRSISIVLRQDFTVRRTFGDRAGRLAVSRGHPRRAQPARPQQPRRHRALGSFTTVHSTSALPGARLQPLSPPKSTASRPGFSQGQAIETMQKLAAEMLPEGFDYE